MPETYNPEMEKYGAENSPDTDTEHNNENPETIGETDEQFKINLEKIANGWRKTIVDFETGQDLNLENVPTDKLIPEGTETSEFIKEQMSQEHE